MAALVKYKYLGLSSVVEVDYPTPQVKLDLHGPTPGTYTGLDRFGRVINHPWINYGASPDEDVARIQHGYDRNSNRLWRQNDVARALSKKFDQQYTYDGLNRLTDAKTGLLNGGHIIPPGSDTTFQQKWSLDYVGNWSAFNQDDDGGGTFDLEQTRTANPVNEITNITATTGPTWITPEYDPAGNTTSFPKPAAPTESFTAVYDAWNRMVRVIDNETDDIVQENVYDGRNFRIVKKTYDAGVLDETRHIYYTSAWQAIEERLGTDPDSADPAQQYVWGIRYIDDLVLRDRDTSEPPDGVLNERLFALQDPNWNVTTIIDDSGDVQERYEYEAYGRNTFLTSSFEEMTASAFDIDRQFSTYVYDAASLLYFARMRYYLPITGAWTSRDSLYYDSFNLYQYAMSNSINNRDTVGKQTERDIEILRRLGEMEARRARLEAERAKKEAAIREEQARNPNANDAGEECCCIAVELETNPNPPTWHVYSDKVDGSTGWRIGFQILAKFQVKGNPSKCIFTQPEEGKIVVTRDLTGPFADTQQKANDTKTTIEGRPDNTIKSWKTDGDWLVHADDLGAWVGPKAGGVLRVELIDFRATVRCQGTDGSDVKDSLKYVGSADVTKPAASKDVTGKPTVNNGATLTASP